MKTIKTFFFTVIVVVTCQPAFSQPIAVSGYVFNETTGSIIANASVFEAAQGIGTISNNNGYYKLLLKPGEKEFKVSDSGYEAFTKRFELKNDTTLTIHLKPFKSAEEVSLKHADGSSLKKRK